MKKVILSIFTVLMILLPSYTVFSDILTKVGVVDYKVIYDTYMKRTLVDIGIDYFSDKLKELEQDYSAKMQEFNSKLSDSNLTDEQKEAIKTDKENYLKKYQEQKQKYLDYINDYRKNKDKYNLEHISYCVKKVAEKEGYAVILDINSKDLIYAAPYIDLTAKVLDYIIYFIEKTCKEGKIDVNIYYYPYIQNESESGDSNSSADSND